MRPTVTALAAFLGLACSSTADQFDALAIQHAESIAGQSPTELPSFAGAAGCEPGCAETGGAGEFPTSNFAWINEVKVDPPGTDGDAEFVEIRGQPMTSLAGYWLLSIEGDKESNRGQVDKAIDLADCGSDGPCRLDAQGLLLLVADNKITTPPSGSSTRQVSELHNGGLENGTNSLWLVAGSWSGGVGLDLDIDDDGILELPGELAVADAVAWTDGDANDCPYAPTMLGPKPKPQAMWSCADEAGNRSWQFGQLLGTAESLVTDVSHRFPSSDSSAHELSPGSANRCLNEIGASMDPQAAGNAGAEARGGATNGSLGDDPMTAAGRGGTSGAGGAPRPANTSGAAAAVMGGSAPLASSTLSTTTASTASTAGRTYATSAPTSAPGTGGRATTSQTTANIGKLVGGAGGGAGATNCIAGCGGVAPITVRARADSGSGTSSWWSPNPFSSGADAGAAPSGAAFAGASAGKTSGPSTSAPPALGGCACSTRRGSSHWFDFLWLVLTAELLRRWRLARRIDRPCNIEL